jgi:hypothetical protein
VSIQQLDLTKMREREKVAQPLRAHCAFIIEEPLLWKLRELTAQNHYKSVSHLLRMVTLCYLEQEMAKQEEAKEKVS